MAKAQGYLRPIDTDEIARRMDLARAGADRGRQELPPSSSNGPDAIEQQITQELEGEWSWHGAELINNLRAYAARLIAFSISTELANLRLKAQDTLAKLRNAHHRAEAELGPLRETFIAYRDELREFRLDNKLKRVARNPENRATTIGLLVLLVGLESGLNGFFFAQGAELGLLGGIVTAFAISFANVVVSFSVGLLPMRWLNYRNPIVKLFGAVFSVAGIASLVALHGFAAHYRDATAAVGEDRALVVGFDTLKSAPFFLANINSFYLFGLGLILAIAAIWKGYTFDDPYPKYGAYHRRAERARNEYSDEHAVLFEDLEEIKGSTVSALDEGIRRVPLFPQQVAKVRAQREAELQSFQAYESSVEAAANRLLALYRDANRSVRKTPSPSHFETHWKLPRSFLADTAVLREIADPVTPPIDANAALEELRGLSKTVLEEYEELMLSYPHPTQM